MWWDGHTVTLKTIFMARKQTKITTTTKPNRRNIQHLDPDEYNSYKSMNTQSCRSRALRSRCGLILAVIGTNRLEWKIFKWRRKKMCTWLLLWLVQKTRGHSAIAMKLNHTLGFRVKCRVILTKLLGVFVCCNGLL